MEAVLSPVLESSCSDLASSTLSLVRRAPLVPHTSQHCSPSPVLRKKHKKQRCEKGHLLVLKKGKQGEGSGVQLVLGCSSCPSPMAAPLTPPRRLSAVQDPLLTLGSHCGTSGITVSSTPEAFVVATRNFLLLPVPPTPVGQFPPLMSMIRREHGAPSSFPALGPSVPSRASQPCFLL